MHPLFEFILLIFAGFFSSLYGSVVGAGGLVKFPAMIFLGVPLNIAIGTNKLVLVFSDVAASVSFYKRGLIQRGIFKLFIISVPLSILGALTVSEVNESTINIFVACSFIILLVLLPFVSKIKTADTEMQPVSVKYAEVWFSLVTIILCFYVGFYGVGFGTFMIFAFVLLRKSSFLEACANTRMLSTSTSLVTAGIFIYEGLVDYQLLLPLAIGSIIGSIIGVKTAVSIDSVWIKRALALVIVVSAIKLFTESFG